MKINDILSRIISEYNEKRGYLNHGIEGPLKREMIIELVDDNKDAKGYILCEHRKTKKGFSYSLDLCEITGEKYGFLEDGEYDKFNNEYAYHRSYFKGTSENPYSEELIYNRYNKEGQLEYQEIQIKEYEDEFEEETVRFYDPDGTYREYDRIAGYIMQKLDPRDEAYLNNL